MDYPWGAFQFVRRGTQLFRLRSMNLTPEHDRAWPLRRPEEERAGGKSKICYYQFRLCRSQTSSGVAPVCLLGFFSPFFTHKKSNHNSWPWNGTACGAGGSNKGSRGGAGRSEGRGHALVHRRVDAEAGPDALPARRVAPARRRVQALAPTWCTRRSTATPSPPSRAPLLLLLPLRVLQLQPRERTIPAGQLRQYSKDR
jgi:hypothetical protein